MSCKKPLIRIQYLDKWETAKDGHKYNKAAILRYEEANFESYRDFNYRFKMHRMKIDRIPCGKCIECRLDYSKDWATRACYEKEFYKENYFLTLTYDDKHLPKYDEITTPSGTFYNDGTWGGTLRPEDMTLFIKRLRKHYNDKYGHQGIRFIYAGEYGETTQRPHYHAIFFNLPIKPEKLKFYKYTETHEALYNCPEIEKIWGKGSVVIGEVTWSSCAYVARYVTKKIGLPVNVDYYAAKGQEPEFMRTSRRPGIGRDWYELNKDQVEKFESMIIHKYNGEPLKVRTPKYYEKLYLEEMPENEKKIRKLREKRRKSAETAEKLKMKHTSLDLKQQWKIEEENKLAQTTMIRKSPPKE